MNWFSNPSFLTPKPPKGGFIISLDFNPPSGGMGCNTI